MIAGVGAAALLLLMFLPWYGVEVNVSGFSASENGNAWETLEFIDILLFLLAVTTLGVVGARLLGSMPDDFPWPMLLLAAGGLAALLVLFRVIDIPAPDVPESAADAVDFERKIGLFLALIATAAMAYGGWRSTSERPAGPPGPAAPA
jgi:purine-cytosine permease-like protein